ncbi:hypothetical protein ABNK63_02310 [Rhodanobacter sp. IGA1.0]|uniref:PH domain-containing protein n=1 Tax=Rhodanobacter sp. IGA1.0 TaxID=3158582 RepID=A0AAU7QLW5_9GAMM
MQRLSSSSTGFYKRVFPVLWFGFIVLFFAFSLWARLQPGSADDRPPDLIFLAMPLMMAAIGFVVFRRLIFDLMDEVWLDGDWLVVTNRGEKRRVPLADVMNINATTTTNPRRITVMLRSAGPLGSEFNFMPASPRGLFNLFKPDPVATALIRRVDAARQAAR